MGNMAWYTHESLVKFPARSRIIIAGSSGSGKSILTNKIIENADGMFSEEIRKIIFCYDPWQSLYDELRKNVAEITFHKGLPSEQQFDEWGEITGHKLLILDDCLLESSNSTLVMKLFCVKSHHLNLSVLFLVQIMFQNGKVMRILSLNTTHFIVFKACRDRNQVFMLLQQIFDASESVHYKQAYALATAKNILIC